MNELTQDQQQVYALLQEGKDIDTIAAALNKKNKAVVAAQITRIKNKGFDIRPKTQSGTKHPPRDHVPTTPEGVVEEAAKSGKAEYDVDSIIARLREQCPNLDERDVHPMILLGTTIQFMRLCGGRMHAHQMIEDVYSAFRLLTGDMEFDEPKIAPPSVGDLQGGDPAIAQVLDEIKQSLAKLQPQTS